MSIINESSNELIQSNMRQGLTFLARIIVRQILEKQREAEQVKIEIEKGMEKEHAALCNQ